MATLKYLHKHGLASDSLSEYTAPVTKAPNPDGTWREHHFVRADQAHQHQVPLCLRPGVLEVCSKAGACGLSQQHGLHLLSHEAPGTQGVPQAEGQHDGQVSPPQHALGGVLESVREFVGSLSRRVPLGTRDWWLRTSAN
eukprot:904777-Rhodomonas_salina.1